MKRFVLPVLLALVLSFAIACGGGSDDTSISEEEAKAAADRYFATTLGLFTGDTQPHQFMEAFAPECQEEVDEAGLAFFVLFVQSFAPALQDVSVEAVDIGPVIVEETEDGVLVTPAEPSSLRVRVEGEFVAASEFFAGAGFEQSDDEIAEPVLLVRRDGEIYLGDCSELEGFSGIGGQP